MSGERSEPLCNNISTQMARQAYAQFERVLEAQITDLRTQLFALIQAKHVLERLYNGMPDTDLKTDLENVGQVGIAGGSPSSDLLAALRNVDNPLLKPANKEDTT